GPDDFAAPQLFDPLRPGDRLQPGRLAAAADVHLPDLVAVCADALRVDIHHGRTAAELAGDLRHERRVADGRRVYADLFRTRLNQPRRVLYGADAAADGERHEQLLRHAADDVEQNVPSFVAGANIQENEFVGPVGFVTAGDLHRVAGVAQLEEVGALDDPAPVPLEGPGKPLR